MFQNPEIKNQVYSLYLPNVPNCFHTRTFLSFFSYEDFRNLQNFDSISRLHTGKMVSKRYCDPKLDVKIKQAELLFWKLQKLSISCIIEPVCNTYETSLITNLTLGSCDLYSFCCLLDHAPMVKYLHIKRTGYESNAVLRERSNGQCALHLKQLVFDDFSPAFEILEFYLSQTPNLKYLTISSMDNSMSDADKWEQLITSSLPCLNTFKFIFSLSTVSVEYDFIIKYERFQTDFWQKQHHWFTEYVISGTKE